MSVDTRTELEVAAVLDARLRRDVLATLAVPQAIPATSGGYNELLPFWFRGDEQPADDTALKLARPRPRPPDDDESQFSPADVVGSPSALGTGYLVLEIHGGGGFTAEPGLVAEEEKELSAWHWLYVPKDAARELTSPYTSAIRQLWRRVFLGRDVFEPFFPAGLGIHSIRQEDPIPAPEPQGLSAGGQFKVVLQRIPLKRRETIRGDSQVIAP